MRTRLKAKAFLRTSIFNHVRIPWDLKTFQYEGFWEEGGVPKLGHESRQAHPLGTAPIPAYINNSICEANEISAHRLLGGKINYWSDLDQFLAPATQLLGYKQGVIGWWGCWQWGQWAGQLLLSHHRPVSLDSTTSSSGTIWWNHCLCHNYDCTFNTNSSNHCKVTLGEIGWSRKFGQMTFFAVG